MSDTPVQDKAVAAWRETEKGRAEHKAAGSLKHEAYFREWLDKRFGITPDALRDEGLNPEYVSGAQPGFRLRTECRKCGGSAETSLIHNWPDLGRQIVSPTLQRHKCPPPPSLKTAKDRLVDALLEVLDEQGVYPQE
jgi:hypothetical protein